MQLNHMAMETSHGATGTPAVRPCSVVLCGRRCSASLSNSRVNAISACERRVTSGTRVAMAGICHGAIQRSNLAGNSDAARRRRRMLLCRWSNLKGRLDFEAPRLEEGFGDVLRVTVPAGPLAQTGGADILIRSELKLLDHLLEGSHGRNNRADWLRLAPIRITTTLCHVEFVLCNESDVQESPTAPLHRTSESRKPLLF